MIQTTSGLFFSPKTLLFFSWTLFPSSLLPSLYPLTMEIQYNTLILNIYPQSNTTVAQPLLSSILLSYLTFLVHKRFLHFEFDWLLMLSPWIKRVKSYPLKFLQANKWEVYTNKELQLEFTRLSKNKDFIFQIYCFNLLGSSQERKRQKQIAKIR